MRVRFVHGLMILILCANSLAAQVVKPRMGFGRAVAFAGDELLVGEANNEAVPGMVFVYARPGNKWKDVATLAAADGKNSDAFGAQLAVDGNRFIAAARGAAYIFERDGRGWRQIAKLAPNVSNAGSQSTRVALGGDVAIIGTFALDNNAGAAFIFRRSGNAWKEEARIQSPQPNAGNQFGNGVAILGDDVLVGEVNAAENTGAVHVFRRQGNKWVHQARLVPGNAQKNDRFGAPIRVHGDRLFIGATGHLAYAGAVHEFERDSHGAYRETRRLVAPGAQSGEQFGSSIAADGTELWIGAPAARQGRGKVYRMSRNASGGWSMADSLSMPQPMAGDAYGSAVAATGTAIAIGIPNDDVMLGSVALYASDANTRQFRQDTVLQRHASAIATMDDGRKDCTGNHAAQFECSNVDMLAFVSADDLGAGRGMMMSSIWGWTDPDTGKEWALVGRMDGTTFVDISNPEKPVVVGNLPLTDGATPNLWREIKVYRNHAFIVADGAGPHGMQVFDLTRLRGVGSKLAQFRADTVYRRVDSAHNIAINEETGFAFITGASGGGQTCGGGLHMVDIRNPAQPVFAGCFSDPRTGRASTGYSHDALCVIYRGPDADYRNREICLGSNETMLSIADVTDKKNPRAVARSSYPNVGYLHQGWLSEEQRFFYANDELDELAGTTTRTRTLIWDLADLDDPQIAGEFLSPTGASDHNLYIKGDTMYQSHYKAGIRIVDISNRTKPVEVGYFDTVPYGDNGVGFGGSWGNYPFFKSGTIITTSMNEGLFILRKKTPNKPVF